MCPCPRARSSCSASIGAHIATRVALSRSDPRGVPSSSATQPMDSSSVQRAFKAALQESGVQKDASVHTLRHSYATHLLKRASTCASSKSISATVRCRPRPAYTHLTRDVEATATEAIQRVMTPLLPFDLL